MWPWEHLAVAYLLGSVAARLGAARPTTGTVLVVGLGSQLPDLIDKPLAWTFGVLPSGRTLGHSAFAALFLSGVVLTLARRYDRPLLGVVFAVAYGSHLLGDLAYGLFTVGRLDAGFLLWPIVSATPDTGMGVIDRFGRLLASFGQFLETSTGRRYLLFEGLLLASATALWFFDGRPGWRWLRQRFPSNR